MQDFFNEMLKRLAFIYKNRKLQRNFLPLFTPKSLPLYHYLFIDLQILEKNLALALIFTLRAQVSKICKSVGQ